MRRTLLAIVAGCAMLAGLAAPALAASDGDLVGQYKVQGWNPGGPATKAPDYTGSFVLRQTDGGLVAQWTTDSKYGGPAIVSHEGGKRLLSIGFTWQGKPGVAVYEVWPDGKTLTGDWSSNGSGAHEMLKR